ncbi:hypothetical protein [Nannocystis punicea]|uniref:HTTM domain-containing protein n=1 Tax=Nannocystis punicea TaxID=2995304 RepID=A0ABY7GX01_9BACT|nr:hypothetical protein [Nannocystis poenicansa]WAS91508.1 hypothetical protein O0S08_35445 [Nannocystis poenicansa]
MSFDLPSLARLLVLSAGYWALDVAVRRGLLHRLADAAGRRHRALAPALGAGGLAVLVATCPWEHVPQVEVARVLMLGLSVMLTWKVVTKDLDPAIGESHAGARLAMLGACVGLWFSPAFVLVVLLQLTRPFAQWRHHAILPLRSLQAAAAFVAVAQLAAPLPDFAAAYAPDAATLLFFVLTIHASHYVSAGLAKVRLGDRWYSWVRDNRLHYMAANAYAWGWGRFVSWPTWRRFVRLIARGDRPLQAGSLALELLAPLALLAPEAALLACAAWSAFHLAVLACGAFWFWDWVGANLVLALALLALPESQYGALFGWQSVLASVAFIAVFPLRNRLWGPTLLAWWETPFTQRMHWLVRGESGTTYEVYSDFMCPHERLYGKVHACFLAPVPLITSHLGTVWDAAHRDAVCAAGPEPQGLDAVRARFGVQPRDERLARNHVDYLHRFFGSLNAGARKHVLPAWLRWLKAPGGHYYYWGDLPAFRGQERVVAASLRFREQYFDGEQLVSIRDELVQELVIDEASARRPCEPEPTSREVELLLGAAFWRSEPLDYHAIPKAPTGARLEEARAK